MPVQEKPEAAKQTNKERLKEIAIKGMKIIENK